MCPWQCLKTGDKNVAACPFFWLHFNLPFPKTGRERNFSLGKGTREWGSVRLGGGRGEVGGGVVTDLYGQCLCATLSVRSRNVRHLRPERERQRIDEEGLAP